MRTDDELDSGVRALRVATASPADGEATRARVLGLVEHGRVRRARVRRAGVAGLAVLATLSLGSAAWTALGHWRARPITTFPVAPSTTPSARRELAMTPPPAPDAPPPAEVSSAPKSTSTVVAPRETPAVVASPGGTGGSGRTSSPAPSPASDGETRAYARAHEAHFLRDAPVEALAAWNRYLSAYPNGAFVPDARYNRALCLLRLGRRGAASQALRPFADGAFHGYRRLEATALLDWLARQPP